MKHRKYFLGVFQNCVLRRLRKRQRSSGRYFREIRDKNRLEHQKF